MRPVVVAEAYEINVLDCKASTGKLLVDGVWESDGATVFDFVLDGR